jgi:hypothetical protein
MLAHIPVSLDQFNSLEEKAQTLGNLYASISNTPTEETDISSSAKEFQYTPTISSSDDNSSIDGSLKNAEANTQKGLKTKKKRIGFQNKASRRWMLAWPTSVNKFNLLQKLRREFKDIQWIIGSEAEMKVYVAFELPKKFKVVAQCNLEVLDANVVETIFAKQTKIKLGRTYEILYSKGEDAKEEEMRNSWKTQIEMSIQEKANEKRALTSHWIDLIGKGFHPEQLRAKILSEHTDPDVHLLLLLLWEFSFVSR